MRSRSFAPEFFSPLPLFAVAVLALNDQVLKFKFPGLITGKLSDIAGCFVLPLFLSACAWRASGIGHGGSAAATP